MFRKDGQLIIIPDAQENRVALRPFIIIGLTDDNRVGVYWPDEQLRHQLINSLTPAQTQALRDGVVNALVQSMNKRLPAVITIR